jgi:hypothetical protein
LIEVGGAFHVDESPLVFEHQKVVLFVVKKFLTPVFLYSGKSEVFEVFLLRSYVTLGGPCGRVFGEPKYFGRLAWLPERALHHSSER